MKKSRHSGTIILRVFHLPSRTQLNEVHAQLNKKLRLEILTSLWEIRWFRMNRSIEFYEIWQENTLANR